MTKQLTEGQKLARKAIRIAAMEIIRQVDSLEWRHDCVEFSADFHLNCVRYDKGTFYGKPCATGMPVYSGHITTRR